MNNRDDDRNILAVDDYTATRQVQLHSDGARAKTENMMIISNYF